MAARHRGALHSLAASDDTSLSRPSSAPSRIILIMIHLPADLAHGIQFLKFSEIPICKD